LHTDITGPRCSSNRQRHKHQLPAKIHTKH
jgi:hypothetical protein